MANKAGNTPVVAHPHLPDIFADEALSFDHVHGTVRISFATLKLAEPVAPSPLHYVGVARVVMPQDGAQRLAIALFDFLKKQGLDPADIIGGADATKN